MEEPRTESLSQRKIAALWWPLAVSWLFMALEAPIAVSTISRLPDPKINTAAFQILMALSLWIESPVIDLLSTATTLVRNGRDYLAIRLFATQMIVGVTLVHALVALTPLYWFVTTTLLGVPREVAEAARIPMAIMIPWSGFIGWRRYLQGILIRQGLTKLIGWGTGVRVTAMFGVSYGLSHSGIGGAEAVAWALLTSVASESMFVHFVSLTTVRHGLRGPQPGEALVDARKVASFHFPLTLTTMVTMLGAPMISAALARSPEAITALAAFPVATSIIWMMRTVIFALPEVVITLYRPGQAEHALRRFSLTLGLVLSGTMVLAALTGLDKWIFRALLGANAQTADMAHLVFASTALAPLLNALQNYLRGVLTACHRTTSRLVSVAASVAVLGGVLGAGMFLRWNGPLTAGIALTLSLLAELLMLAWFWSRQSGPRQAQTALQ